MWERALGKERPTNDEEVGLGRITSAPAHAQMTGLADAVAKLNGLYGGWRVPWGTVNRFQRNDGSITQTFDDKKASIAVPFPSARWGSLAAFEATTYPGTAKRYGTRGNSFVAVVEFGDRVIAKAVTAGGLSSNVSSRHFNDQADRYAKGELRDVYFYRDQLNGHTEREYKPGQ